LKAEDLLFSHPFPVVVTDGEGKIKLVNQKFEALVNRSQKYLKGKYLFSLLEGGEKLKKHLLEAYNKSIDVLGVRLGDRYFSFSPLYVSNNLKGVVVVVEPAGELSFGEDILLLLKGLSHEIRNPLGGIKGAAKLFKELSSYDEELVNVMIEEIERIERLLNDVVRSFDFSSLSFKKENIHRLIQQAVELFSSRISEMDIEILYRFDPSLPEIPVDADRLLQALINLIKNAIEAMEECPRRILKLETGYAIHPSGFIFIKVSDTGKGMDSEELKNFSLPFFTTKEKGLGLGSFIVREVVKGHGGELKVESRKGEGTSVTLLLPMKREDGKDSCGR